jgi:hypothetical protein
MCSEFQISGKKVSMKKRSFVALTRQMKINLTQVSLEARLPRDDGAETETDNLGSLIKTDLKKMNDSVFQFASM